MQRAFGLAIRRWWPAWLIGALVIALFAQPKARTAPGEGAQPLAADEKLGEALRGGDKSAVRKLLALQFTYVDENGKVHERRDFIADLAASAAGAATEAKVEVYGLVAIVTGQRKSARGDNVFFLDIWAQQKRAWRLLAMQDVRLADVSGTESSPTSSHTSEKIYDCENPCLTVPYRVRSPAEQEVINSFQAAAKAAAVQDGAEWGKHAADDFVLHVSGRAPFSKADEIAAIERQKQNEMPAAIGEVQTMRLAVFGDGGAMTATEIMPDTRTAYRVSQVWVRRGGQWLMAISARTAVQ